MRRESKARGRALETGMLVRVCVQPVEAMYVFLSDPRINDWTARSEETGLSVGREWD